VTELGACSELPFLRVYERAGALKQRDGGAIVLDLPVNVHSADCGAPDCWGHEMELTLRLGAKQGRCEVVAAIGSARPFNECGVTMDGPTSPWTNTFSALGAADLAAPNFARLHLHDAARNEALVLLPSEYFFYVHVTATTPLKHELEGEQVAPGFTYGYSSSAAQLWKTQFAPPSPKPEQAPR